MSPVDQHTVRVPVRQARPLPRLFKRDPRIHKLWAYVMADMRYGNHTPTMKITDTVLVMRGMFAEAQEAVEQWIDNRYFSNCTTLPVKVYQHPAS